MSTREMANTIYYALNEEQLKKFIALFGLSTIKEVEPDEFDKELIADSMIDNDEEMDFDDFVRSLELDPNDL